MAVAMVLRPGRETRERRECLDFGDEAVRMKAPEEARDLTGLLFRLRGQGIRGPRELLSHNTVGEAVQGVFPRQEHLKEHALVARQGVERPDRSACGRGSSSRRWR